MKTQRNPLTLIASKKLEILQNQSKIGLPGSCLISSVVVIVFWNHTKHPILGAWLGFYYAVSYVRYHYLTRDCLQNPQQGQIEKTLKLYTFLTFLSGISWGLMSIYILHENVLTYGVFIIIVAGGLTAASTTVYAVYPSVFVSFSFPTMLLPGIYLLLQKQSIENVQGGLLIIFLTVMTVSVIRMRTLIMQSIGLQFTNLHLLNEIEQEKERVSELNRQLETDLENLRQRDTQLSDEKDRAENLAKKLLVLSTRDGLTGIANRRYFDEFLAKEWNRAVRSGTNLSLIMCDIDHFKAYNDRYGHQQGDRCLQQIASILEDHARRGGDLAARYGGEEFAIVLPDTSLENAVINAEKIKHVLEKTAIPHEASAVSNVITLSMGIAAIQPSRDIFSAALISQADKLLYQAKATGRNKIVWAECDTDVL